jgi:hypothetical protein
MDLNPQQQRQSDLHNELRIATLDRFIPTTLEDLTTWLGSCGVDVAQADTGKGLQDLFHKVLSGEAELVYDETTRSVYRIARVVRIDASITIHGERYRPFEMVQIFRNPSSNVASEQPRAMIRNTSELWETLHHSEVDYSAAAQRGVGEELGIKESERSRIGVDTQRPTQYIEEPIDWPGIPSLLTEVRATATVPEDLSKPSYIERNATGTKAIVTVALPDDPQLQNDIGLVWPLVSYRPPEIDQKQLRGQLVRAIMQYGEGSSIYVMATGGGGDIISELAQFGGSSRIYSGGSFPYATSETARILGYTPSKYVSAEVSEGLATAAYLQAQRNWIEDQSRTEAPPRFIGLGITAAIASNRPRRGEDAVWISVQTPEGLSSQKYLLAKDHGDTTRSLHNDAITSLGLNTLAITVGATPLSLSNETVIEGLSENNQCRIHPAKTPRLTLDHPCLVRRDGSLGDFSEVDPNRYVIYPGSFRGFTAGHHLVARKAAEQSGKQVLLEISVTNVDKPAIEESEASRRLHGFRGLFDAVLVQAPLFTQKSILYPRATTFAVGMDTAKRLVDTRYYSGKAARDEALELFRRRDNRFLVMSRRDSSGALETIEQVSELQDYLDIFTALPGSLDVSSTALFGR